MIYINLKNFHDFFNSTLFIINCLIAHSEERSRAFSRGWSRNEKVENLRLRANSDRSNNIQPSPLTQESSPPDGENMFCP